MTLDLLVIGGGINGVGIARDAAGRGLKVALLEAGDLGGATSAASSKLIHGGLRYLETYEFGLVRASLLEREILARAAPHLVQPLTFVLPHDRFQRPRWMIRAGLFLYDCLAHSDRFARSRAVDLNSGVFAAPLKPDFRHGFTYSDGWTDDARLVILNAMDARLRGAEIWPRTRAVEARPQNSGWHVVAEDRRGRREFTAKAIVNATGPWASEIDRRVLGVAKPPRLRLIKGSHIIAPRLYPGDHAYLLQATDGRVVFVLPFEDDYHLIGTTEVEIGDMDAPPAVTPAEISYLCDAVGRFFRHPPRAEEVIHSFAGVRPLYDDGRADPSKMSRDYVLKRHLIDGATALTVYGGKLTTYRRLAEAALKKISSALPQRGAPWTHAGVLPGGDFFGGPEALLNALRERAPWLPEETAERWARSYGAMSFDILAKARNRSELGAEIIPGLCEQEARHLVRHEWAMTADDILWRRTRLGLTAPSGAAEALTQWLARERTGG